MCALPKQALAAEACSLLWSLVDLNPRLLSAFVGCNVEDPTEPPASQPGLWASVLVCILFFCRPLALARMAAQSIAILNVIRLIVKLVYF